MGIAYLVSHPVLRIPLVVKQFKVSPNDDPFCEAHFAARVISPWVVPVLDAGYEDGVCFVMQRYVDGVDVEELIDRQRASGRTLSTNVVIRIVADIARGLHAIHQSGIVHRDVKPANLFVQGDGRALVGDFGIAVESVESMAARGGIAGTPMFMAPELWRAGRVDHRTDLYALGATAHMLATHAPPFEADSLTALKQAHFSQAYVPPEVKDPKRQALFALIEQMLQKRPEDRPGSALSVARTLDQLATAPPVVEKMGPDRFRLGPLNISLEVGDIAAARADVIVNAANVWLAMRRGVAGALHRAGGPALEHEAMSHGRVAMGDVVWTAAGALDARWVAHAVAALEGAVCLQRCVLRVLLGAEWLGAHTVAFPALGTGIGGVPMEVGARLTLEALHTYAAMEPLSATELRFVLFDDDALERWRSVWEREEVGGP
jgi:O-acetyl-ADP-ribose deacetylase (regulator of RNase III)